MVGTITGDTIGSRFEFGDHKNSKFFKLFTDEYTFTDDTICTIAIAEAYYGIPKKIEEEALSYLPEEMLNIIKGIKSQN